ncbi:DNA-binding transcriptional regulator YhcF (GntR family) [Amycolatopsis lexingtonensis]|uniref:DNA-binding transcriptional regulator YhcF (GntR family) n=1 Tax=Amycolatopsis lexingtonensis TaxID=218822 RepID=A0ABR9I760_9PSEU|nr:GntR family transcriptional regulator [Amycolatopsis lexingtonensis]MBE1499024.1 DNA-binding transcriptional regulator YhcF (GntR family) [Amycolatopsis lexingtonensis]
MFVRIDPTSTVPLFEQVAASLRRSLADGSPAPGEQLPPARELAASLEINVHTVLRAYAVLRDEGLIDLRRRRGAVVLGGASAQARLAELVAELVREAKRAGVGLDELTGVLKEKYT